MAAMARVRTPRLPISRDGLGIVPMGVDASRERRDGALKGNAVGRPVPPLGPEWGWDSN